VSFVAFITSYFPTLQSANYWKHGDDWVIDVL